MRGVKMLPLSSEVSLQLYEHEIYWWLFIQTKAPPPEIFLLLVISNTTEKVYSESVSKNKRKCMWIWVLACGLVGFQGNMHTMRAVPYKLQSRINTCHNVALADLRQRILFDVIEIKPFPIKTPKFHKPKTVSDSGKGQ